MTQMKMGTNLTSFRSRNRLAPRPALRFTPTAWAKLLFLRDLGDTEVGGFGISSATDLLLIEDFVLVPQFCTVLTVAFSDEAVADFFDRQIDLGRLPAQFGRIWIHTHPGDCAEPSGVDEETFARVFGRCDWAVMAIVARGGQTYSRIQFAVDHHCAWRLPVKVDFETEFGSTDRAAWQAEYELCVQPALELNCQQFNEEPFYSPFDDFSDLVGRRLRRSDE
jgi:hypothetical protein